MEKLQEETLMHTLESEIWPTFFRLVMYCINSVCHSFTLFRGKQERIPSKASLTFLKNQLQAGQESIGNSSTREYTNMLYITI